MSRKILILLLLLSLFCTIGIREMFEKADLNDRARQGIDNSAYRQEFFAPDMRKNKDFLSDECRIFLNKVEKDSLYFPIPSSTLDDSLTVSYENSWMAERSYKKTNMHEGTDIMASRNERGLYPIVSISDGTVTSLGWLELGGWRVGITSPQGVYYYYAHLESYGDIQKGDTVKAGQILGFMGDSGYGKEGTYGKFAVHLHLGIYCWDTGDEISVNPYYVLRELEKKKLKYAYS